MRQDGQGATPTNGSQTATQTAAQNEGDSLSSNKQESDWRDSLSVNNPPREDASDGSSHITLPVLPPIPTNSFSREEILNDILDLTDQVSSVALFGPIGIGKSFVGLALLHHNRTKANFGQSRYFMHLDDLASSPQSFSEGLSDVIHTNATQLQSRLRSSPPLIILLDGIDSILDSQTPRAKEILAAIEEFGSYEHVCLVTTSRVYPDVRGFHRVEIPILSGDGARDTFYNLSKLDRSTAVDNLITTLDFHPLSICFLASSVRENNWDEIMLLREWDSCQESALKSIYCRELKEVVEPVFSSPAIQRLGTTARDVLEAIAAFPYGVEQRELERIFHKVAGIGEVVDVLCRFSLVYRQGRRVKMLSPFQFYFLESMLVLAQTEEVIHWGPDCIPAKPCTSLPGPVFPLSRSNTCLKGSLYTPLGLLAHPAQPSAPVVGTQIVYPLEHVSPSYSTHLTVVVTL